MACFAFKTAFLPKPALIEGFTDKMTETVTAEANLLYEVRNGVGQITFNRPQARNSLTFDMYERLAAICAMLSLKWFRSVTECCFSRRKPNG